MDLFPRANAVERKLRAFRRKISEMRCVHRNINAFLKQRPYPGPIFSDLRSGGIRMLEVSALFYGVLASFIMASMSRNRREQRKNSPVLAAFGWLMLAFSGAMGTMLLGYAGWHVMAGGAI